MNSEKLSRRRAHRSGQSSLASRWSPPSPSQAWAQGRPPPPRHRLSPRNPCAQAQTAGVGRLHSSQRIRRHQLIKPLGKQHRLMTVLARNETCHQCLPMVRICQKSAFSHSLPSSPSLSLTDLRAEHIATAVLPENVVAGELGGGGMLGQHVESAQLVENVGLQPMFQQAVRIVEGQAFRLPP